ncbi:helix-turn-helix domain-containing protein [Mammaliicoccus sciuri]|uniref:helix-turn-helix domain-containing protein n=1 Tax=Mammaliicoccus sciuri TaxID=1296 RepID=UPI0019529719|nr:helix-turn-helix transcriptional regulator [Mammaliicoccus sciuri]QYG31943.1 helix-turn-helix domain-containing protein [Mammaliicoccus sciuri]
MNKNEIGKRIRQIRVGLGLSMAKFGEEIDKSSPVKSGVVSNWENGKQIPNNQRIKRIAELGNKTVDYLLYGNDEEAYKIGLDFYYHLINEYSESTQIGKALRFFDDKKRKSLIINSINRLFNIPILNEKIKTLNDVKENYGYADWMKDVFYEEYKRLVKTNTNLIYSVEDNILDSLCELEEIENAKDIYTYYPNDSEFPNLSDSVIRIQTIDKGINLKLIEELENILSKTQKEILKLKEKYPDENYKYDNSTLLKVLDHDTAKFKNLLIDTYELEKGRSVNDFIEKDLNTLLREYNQTKNSNKE